MIGISDGGDSFIVYVRPLSTIRLFLELQRMMNEILWGVWEAPFIGHKAVLFSTDRHKQRELEVIEVFHIPKYVIFPRGVPGS